MRFDVYGHETKVGHGFEDHYGYEFEIQAYCAGDADECGASVSLSITGHGSREKAKAAAEAFATTLHPTLAAKVWLCIDDLGRGGIEEHRIDFGTEELNKYEASISEDED